MYLSYTLRNDTWLSLTVQAITMKTKHRYSSTADGIFHNGIQPHKLRVRFIQSELSNCPPLCYSSRLQQASGCFERSIPIKWQNSKNELGRSGRLAWQYIKSSFASSTPTPDTPKQFLALTFLFLFHGEISTGTVFSPYIEIDSY